MKKCPNCKGTNVAEIMYGLPCHEFMEELEKEENEGKYALDITVVWTDGVPQDGLADWYGPTVYVGVDQSVDHSNTENKIPEPDEEESGLPSISLVLALTVTLLVAVSRRQR